MKQMFVPWTLDELLGLLKAPDPADRRSAALRLGAFYCNDPSAAEPLIKVLRDPDPGVRSAAAHALGTIGRITRAPIIAEQAREQLLALLSDKDEEVIASAIYALGQLGNISVGSNLLPFLDYPDRPNVKVYRVAIEALCSLRYQPAISHFSRLLHDSRPGVPSDAMRALFSMRHVSSDVEEMLKSIADDPESPLHEEAQGMLEIIAEEKHRRKED